MKRLEESDLIEMERRADRLLAALDNDPEEMGQTAKEDALNFAFDLAVKVVKDTETLCEYIRQKATP